MPIAKLFVEGQLDTELLNPILQGSPVLCMGGSKYSLKPRTRVERTENKVSAGYLRDRDFDYEPPSDLSKPVMDQDKQECIGWRWCRHEIENYLLEPEIIKEATGCSLDQSRKAIIEAGKIIRYYEAARWTIGSVRQVLPPNYELNSRPDDLKEIDIPEELGREAVAAWALDAIGKFCAKVNVEADKDKVDRLFRKYADLFDDVFVSEVPKILLWFSGKDVLAGIDHAGFVKTWGMHSPKELLSKLRDWVREHPDDALELLPEWRELVSILRA